MRKTLTSITASEKGNQFILTVMDYFTKYVHAVPLPDKSAIGVATALFKVRMYTAIIAKCRYIRI